MSKVTPKPKPFRVRPSRLSKEIRLRRRRSGAAEFDPLQPSSVHRSTRDNVDL